MTQVVDSTMAPVLHAPLLRHEGTVPRKATPLRSKKQAEAARAESSFGRAVRRVAAWHGPDPTATLSFLLCVVGGCYYYTFREHSLEAASHKAAAASVGNLMAGPQEASRINSDGSLQIVDPTSVAPLFNFDYSLSSFMILATIIACILSVLQKLVDRFLLSVVAEALLSKSSGGCRERIGTGVELLGDVGISLFSGQLTAKNIVLQSPLGFQSEYLLKVRRIVADLGGLSGLFRMMMTSRIEVRELRLDGLDIVVEHEFGMADGRKNLQTLINQFEATSTASSPRVATPFESKGEVSVGVVHIEDAVARQWATTTTAAMRASVAERHFANFTKEFQLSEQPGDVLAALAKTVASDALASVAARSM